MENRNPLAHTHMIRVKMYRVFSPLGQRHEHWIIKKYLYSLTWLTHTHTTNSTIMEKKKKIQNYTYALLYTMIMHTNIWVVNSFSKSLISYFCCLIVFFSLVLVKLCVLFSHILFAFIVAHTITQEFVRLFIRARRTHITHSGLHVYLYNKLYILGTLHI